MDRGLPNINGSLVTLLARPRPDPCGSDDFKEQS